MKILEQILEEIEDLIIHSAWPNMNLVEKEKVEKIIRSHMEDNGWIPITYREIRESDGINKTECPYCLDCPLPDNGDEIIVCDKCGNVYLDTYCDDGGEVYLDCSNADIISDIVAWRPLPDPYRKKEADHEED